MNIMDKIDSDMGKRVSININGGGILAVSLAMLMAITSCKCLRDICKVK